MKGRLKFLKLLSDFRSKNYELEYVREILKEAHLEFEIYHREWCAKNNIDLAALNKQNQKKVDIIFANKDESALKLREKPPEKPKKDLKSLYKNIAKKLHPDKLRDDDPRKWEYEEAFKKVTEANRSQKWGEVFDVVDKYDIYLGDYDEPIECLKEDIKRVEEELKKEKSTFSWALHEAQEEQEKAQVIKNFLRQMFGWKK